MSASPEFYKPAAPAAFSSPCASPLPAGLGLGGGGGGGDDDYFYGSCRTPTGSGISFLKEPTTCPPAPRKPPAPVCKKRLFKGGAGDTAEVPLISLRMDDLERIFRPRPSCDKRRRSSAGDRSPRDPPTQAQQKETLD